MHDFLLLLAAAGFGALAWAMLAVSDWLLRDKNRAEPSTQWQVGLGAAQPSQARVSAGS